MPTPRAILQGLIDREAGQAVTEAVPADPCQQDQAKAALLVDGALGLGRDPRGFRGVITSPGDTPVIIEYWRARRLGIVGDDQTHSMNGVGERSSWNPGQRRDGAGE